MLGLNRTADHARGGQIIFPVYLWRLRGALMALTLAALLAGCGGASVGTEPIPPSGLAAGNVLSDASAVLDRRTNGPNAWTYTVNVGKSSGQNRLFMAYVLNDYGAGSQTPLGTNSDAQFIARIKDLSAQYEKLDPAHPVVPSIDLVDPVADGFPGTDGLYRHARAEERVQHFIDLATQNKMLFFFDTQVGRSTQQREVGTLLKYMEQPNVHLALDPEWEMGPHDIPGVIPGRTYAASINWVIDQLSTLVTTKHLPDKILVIHKFRNYVAPDWQNIVPKPGVNIIISIDAQGRMNDKIATYNILTAGHNDQFGFKVFLQIPCDGSQTTPYCEDPIMTPQQVLALKPTPVMIQYQ